MDLMLEKASQKQDEKALVRHSLEGLEGVSGLGPALTLGSLAALSDIDIKDAILNGRPGTSMTGFKDRLGPEEINALLQLIKYTSP